MKFKLIAIPFMCMLLLSSMKSGAAHDYSAKIGPLQDTIIPDFYSDLTFLDNGAELTDSPVGWKYSFTGDKVDVSQNGTKYFVYCKPHKSERHALLMIYMDNKVVFKKLYPIPEMTDALKKRVDQL